MAFERRESDNIVRLSSSKDLALYFQSVVMRASPKIYKKYGSIKLRFTKDLKTDVQYLCNLFWHLGLIVSKDEEIEKVVDTISTSRGNYIKEMYEVKLKKIGAIDFEDEDDYLDWMKDVKKQWDKIK